MIQSILRSGLLGLALLVMALPHALLGQVSPREFASHVLTVRLSAENGVFCHACSQAQILDKLKAKPAAQAVVTMDCKVRNIPPDWLAQYPLIVLVLGNSSIKNMPSLAAPTMLRFLDLGGNKLRSLPADLQYWKQLRYFSLSNNRLRAFPGSILQLRQLEELSLSGNPIVDLQAGIGDLQQLQVLELEGTQLRALPVEVGNLKRLHWLGLANSPIVALPEEIGNLDSLVTLDLTATGIKALPEALRKLQGLRNLQLGRAPLTDPLSELEKIGDLGALEILCMDGQNLPKLPESIGRMQSLAAFSCRNCKIEQLPEALFAMPNLRSLDITGHRLDAAQIARLKTVQNLNVKFGDTYY